MLPVQVVPVNPLTHAHCDDEQTVLASKSVQCVANVHAIPTTAETDIIRAVTCDFQQCGILTSVDSDEPVQPPVKLRNSKWCSVGSLTIIEYSSD